jgi:hypothetical protein
VSGTRPASAGIVASWPTLRCWCAIAAARWPILAAASPRPARKLRYIATTAGGVLAAAPPGGTRTRRRSRSSRCDRPARRWQPGRPRHTGAPVRSPAQAARRARSGGDVLAADCGTGCARLCRKQGGASFGKLLRQPQREDHREAWRLDRSLILGGLKSRSVEKPCTSIDLRWTEICHAHFGMR